MWIRKHLGMECTGESSTCSPAPDTRRGACRMKLESGGLGRKPGAAFVESEASGLPENT